MTIKKKALGRGISALLESGETDVTSNKLEVDGSKHLVGSVSSIAIAQIEANPFQPRTTFEKEALLELAESIKVHGIIQPITVRKLGYDKYQLISGERRFRASQIAGLTSVPAYVRVANDQAMLEMALVENIQRENLDAIEVAISYKRLIDECNLTQEQLSEKVSKQRSTVTNYLRLLKLPTTIQLSIREGKISMGQARTLINIENSENQLKVFNSIINDDLSVREAEELVRTMKNKKGSSVKKATNLSIEYQKLQDALHKHFSKKVFVTGNDKGSGKIVIPFKSSSELDLLIKKLDL